MKQELNDLQSKYEANGYNQLELDDVIDALQRVAKDSHLTSRDREMARANW